MTTLTEEQIAELRAKAEASDSTQFAEWFYFQAKTTVLALLDDREALKRERDDLREALTEATRDTVRPMLNALAEKLAGLGEDTFLAKNAYIDALEAELEAARRPKTHTVTIAADSIMVTGDLITTSRERDNARADLARVTAELAEATKPDAVWVDRAHQAEKLLAEYKRAVAEQLHYDMQSVITGTPEERAAAALAERTRERDAARKVATGWTRHTRSCARVTWDKALERYAYDASVQCTCGLDAARREAGL